MLPGELTLVQLPYCGNCDLKAPIPEGTQSESGYRCMACADIKQAITMLTGKTIPDSCPSSTILETRLLPPYSYRKLLEQVKFGAKSAHCEDCRNLLSPEKLNTTYPFDCEVVSAWFMNPRKNSIARARRELVNDSFYVHRKCPLQNFRAEDGSTTINITERIANIQEI
jgi:hypothetical protein